MKGNLIGMYETYTRQSLPSKHYRELLGTSLVVFNANNSFLIESILKINVSQQTNWYKLIDLSSGDLKKYLDLVTQKTDNKTIEEQFNKLIIHRNRCKWRC